MISALIQGELIQDPRQRTTIAGKTYSTAAMRVGAGTESVLIGVTAFSDTAQVALLRLKAGDGLAASGVLELNIWQDREGKERRDWRLTATQIMSLYEATKRRKTAAEMPDMQQTCRPP